MAQEVIPSTAPTSSSPQGKLTYEQFLAWIDEDTHAEWVDGEVVPMSPVSDEHQDLGGFLLALFRPFVEIHALGIVRYEPFQMKTGADLPGRLPDLMFIANTSLPRLKKTYLDGPADLVVEIFSPESAGRDRGDKFYEYQRGGVREYWLLDQPRRQAEFYQRGEAGIYRPMPIGDEGILHSVVLDGLWLKVEWLWQEPLPPVLSVLKEWGLI